MRKNSARRIHADRREWFYAWDVPEGMWQVKVEKEGYETAYSEIYLCLLCRPM